MEYIQNELFKLQDEGYREFQRALIPTVDKIRIIGVRIPELRRLSKQIDMKSASAFMGELPHEYYEEDNLHAFLIERITDIDLCFKELDRFLPYVDNWATCDMMAPKVLIKDKELLLSKAYEWMASDHVYTIRYGISVLMKYFLDDAFSTEYANKVASVVSDEYYVNMMCAWYFATALAKQYDSIVPYLEEKKLPVWVHNKTISKAKDSLRISKETKEYLNTLKINQKSNLK